MADLIVEVPFIEPLVVTTGHHCLEQAFSGGVSIPCTASFFSPFISKMSSLSPGWRFFFQLWWIHLLWIVFSQYHPHSVSISIEVLNRTTVLPFISVCNSAFWELSSMVCFPTMCTSNAFMPPNVRITPAIFSSTVMIHLLAPSVRSCSLQVRPTISQKDHATFLLTWSLCYIREHRACLNVFIHITITAKYSVLLVEHFPTSLCNSVHFSWSFSLTFTFLRSLAPQCSGNQSALVFLRSLSSSFFCDLVRTWRVSSI